MWWIRGVFDEGGGDDECGSALPSPFSSPPLPSHLPLTLPTSPHTLTCSPSKLLPHSNSSPFDLASSTHTTPIHPGAAKRQGGCG